MFPTPVTLLVAQCVLVAVSIVPITMVARRLLGRWQGLAVGFAYAFAWGIQSAIDVQFHEYALAVPILAFGLAAFLSERWAAGAVWMIALLGVKEDLDQDMPQERRSKTFIGWQCVAGSDRQPERQLGKRARLMKPPVVGVMLQDSACDLGQE